MKNSYLYCCFLFLEALTLNAQPGRIDSTSSQTDVRFENGYGGYHYVNSANVKPDGKVNIQQFGFFIFTSSDCFTLSNAKGSLEALFSARTRTRNYVYNTSFQSHYKISIRGDFTKCNVSSSNRVAPSIMNESRYIMYELLQRGDRYVYISAFQTDR